MARFAVLLIILVSFVGCSLVDPFVTRKKPAPPPLTESVSLTDAFDYAAKVKDAYRSALRDQACLQSWLGIGLVPLTAAAIGLGATGSSANTVLSLGLAGTSALGIGTWLYNKPRQLAWVAGLKAVTCAEDAMEPLNFSSSARTDLDTNLDGLRVGLQTLDQKTAKLETEADKAKALREAANTDKPEISSAVRALQSLETSARAELEELKALKTAAEAALTNGAELKQTLTIAGGRLVVAVKKITDEVDSIVVDTQRDPQALTNIIAGLGSTYGTLTSVPKGIAPQVAKDKASKQPPSTPQRGLPPDRNVQQKEEIQKEIKPIEAQEESLVDALQAVREAEATVASRRRVLSDIVNSVVRDTPLDKLKGCGVKAGDLKTALTVDPGGPFEIKKPGSVAFTIKGGLPPYGATLAGGLAGLIVAQSAPFSPAVNVVATNDTAEGQFAVVISDSSDQSKTVMVTVKKGDGKPDGEQQKPAATDALNQFAVKLNQDRPIVTVDGVTVTVTKAEMTGDRVVVSIADPQVTPNAKTDSVATEVRKELWDKHGGKQLNLQENQIVFDNNSLGMLNKAALDAKKTKTGRKK